MSVPNSAQMMNGLYAVVIEGWGPKSNLDQGMVGSALLNEQMMFEFARRGIVLQCRPFNSDIIILFES